MNDMECEVLITQDAGWRKGSEVPLKKTADAAMTDAPTVKSCVVVHRKDADVEMVGDRDVWYHELAEGVTDDPESCPCEQMDAEDVHASDRAGWELVKMRYGFAGDGIARRRAGVHRHGRFGTRGADVARYGFS